MTDKPIPVRASRRFRASPEQVFVAWLNADTAGEWLFATADGQMLQVEIDPRVGGHFHIVERRGDQKAAHHGVYVEMDRPRRLAFNFSVGGVEAGPTRVTVEIAPDGRGSALTLTHGIDPAWADHVERTAQGWAAILDRLAASLGEGSPPS
jgi:uncharacterized protein YndB with AHSA1/START domain